VKERKRERERGTEGQREREREGGKEMGKECPSSMASGWHINCLSPAVGRQAPLDCAAARAFSILPLSCHG